MSTSRLPAPDVPVPAVPSREETLIQNLEEQMRHGSRLSTCFRGALEDPSMPEATIHYLLDVVGRMKTMLNAVAVLLVQFERERDDENSIDTPLVSCADADNKVPLDHVFPPKGGA